MQEIINQIKARKAHKIFLQLPEGLKIRSTEMVKEIEKEGIEVIVGNDPCYGACDIKDDAAHSMGCDLLVHVGHNKFYVDFSTKVPVLYVPWEMKADFSSFDFSKIKENKIGILTSIQHMTMISEIKKNIEKAGKTAVIGGQILGCWTVNAEKIENDVEAFVFIGTGKFHPLRVKNKPIYVLDLETNNIEKIDTDFFDKRRYANIYNASSGRNFGILVSTKKGQNQLQSKAENIKRQLNSRQRDAFMIVMDEITNSKIMGIKADAFINTACPRITDDSFDKPVINAEDLEELLKLWDNKIE